jgi:hypothetical protein
MVKIQHQIVILWLVAGLMIVGTASSWALNAPSITHATDWVNLGMGVSSLGGALGGSFSHQFGHHIISLRGIYTEEVTLFGTSPPHSVWDGGILYGRSHKTPHWLASISAGLGVAGVMERGRFLYHEGGWFGHDVYEKKHYLEMAIPIEGQLFWTFSSFLGIGIDGFADLNLKKSVGGGLFCIQVGKLR